MAVHRATERQERIGFWLYAGHVWTVFGIALSNGLLGLTLLWSAGRLRLRARELWRRAAPLLLPLTVYVILLFVSVLASIEPATSAPELRELVSLLTLVLAPVLVRGEDRVRRVFDVLLAVIVVIALHGIFQYYFTDYGTIQHRIRGPFSHYMTFAGVLVIGNLLLLARLLTGDGWRRSWHWAALALFTWALFLSLTRGSWVALALTVTVYALARGRRYYRAYLAVAGLVALFVALGPDIGLDRIRSIGDLRDPSNYDRLCMANAALYMISERPLFGLGPGMVEERYPIYRHPTAPRYTVPHLHNSFLELAAERGLISLAAYLWLMAAGLWLAWRAYRRDGGPHGPRADLYLGVMLVLVGFNLGGLFEDNWRDTEVQRLILFLLAVPLCLGRQAAGAGARAADDETP